MSRSAWSPAGGGLAWNDVQPVGARVQLIPLHAETAQTNWSTRTTVAGMATGLRESSGAQNAEVTFKIALARGTWKLHMVSITQNNLGIITVSLDGVSQGTIDLYTSSQALNALLTLTGIAALTSGLHDLNFKMATKNASSSNYFGELGQLTFERTA